MTNGNGVFSEIRKQVENAIRRNAPSNFWSCKKENVADIKFATYSTLAKINKYWEHIPKFTFEEVYGDTFWGFIDNFRDDFHRMLKDQDIMLFVVEDDVDTVIVNTEGYNYARYTARIPKK